MRRLKYLLLLCGAQAAAAFTLAVIADAHVKTSPPTITVTPPAGYQCKPPVLFGQKTTGGKKDSVFFEVACGQ